MQPSLHMRSMMLQLVSVSVLKLRIPLLTLLLLLVSCQQQELTEQTQSEQKKPGQQTSSLSTQRDQWQNVYSFGEATQVGDEFHLISSGVWFLLSKQRYKDFIFTADVKMPKTDEYSNSGILFRAQTRPNKSGNGQVAWGYQAEVDPSDRKWSGGLYEQGHREWLNPLHKTRSHPDKHFKQNLSPEWSDQKANAYRHTEWNRYRIEAKGAEIKIWVNDVLTTHVIDTHLSEGFIGIQHHGSHAFKTQGNRKNTIRFKNISLIEL